MQKTVDKNRQSFFGGQEASQVELIVWKTYVVNVLSLQVQP